MTNPPYDAVVFDLGGVLIDWNPRYLYRKLFVGDEAGMDRFLGEVCTLAWNFEQDGGRSWAEGSAFLKARHPGEAALIDAYRQRWPEMLGEPFADTLDIVRDLNAAGIPLFALTNFSAETFPIARELYDFLGWFDDIVVSGEVKLLKPDPRIYQLLIERHGLDPARTIFIDDNLGNAEAAAALGIRGIHFTGAEALREELISMGLLKVNEAVA